MHTYTGPAYRVGAMAIGDAVTAADVVRFEQEELGNDLGVPVDVWPLLEAASARDVVWVCRNEHDALRYGGDVRELRLYQAVVVCAEDGDGGMLVLARRPA